MRCHCYRARSLIASDETGLSDPFLSITAGNETQTTPVNQFYFLVFFFLQFVFDRFSKNHYVHNGV
jgi:hypothetical protein